MAGHPGRRSESTDFHLSAMHIRNTKDLEEVDESLKSTRGILLTINVICAFLFILIFEMIFGWQSLRPSASQKIIVENIAKLATYHDSLTSIDSKSQEFKILQIADTCISLMLSGADSIQRDFITLRHGLDSTLSKHPPWIQENYFRRIGFEFGKLDTMMGMVNSSCYPEIYFCYQEIMDRFEVNEETRGRRISRLEKAFPIIGASFQNADMVIPVALFLILLSYWLYTSLLKAHDCAYSFLRRNDFCIRMNRDILKLLLAKFQFYNWRPLDEFWGKKMGIGLQKKAKRAAGPTREANSEGIYTIKWRRGVIWLFMTPYLVVMSEVISYIHEAYILDYRYHGSAFLLTSHIQRHFDLLIVPVLIIAALTLAYIGWKLTWNHEVLFLKFYFILNATNISDEFMSKTKQVFYWIMFAPFVIFGLFSLIYLISLRFNNSCYPVWYMMVFWWVVILYYSYVGFMMLTNRWKANKARRSLIIIFGGIPMLIVILILSVCLIPLIFKNIGSPICLENWRLLIPGIIFLLLSALIGIKALSPYYIKAGVARHSMAE